MKWTNEKKLQRAKPCKKLKDVNNFNDDYKLVIVPVNK